MTAADRRIAAAAADVRKYWRDWPQEKRDAVRGLSSFLADAIEELAKAVAVAPARGTCTFCGDAFNLTKAGVLREHLGNHTVGLFRQTCAGSGTYPVVSS